MSWQTELQSWMFPTTHPATDPPAIGQKAPKNAKLKVGEDGNPTIVTFLRHCGCPFAEKTFKNLKDVADNHKGIKCVAISHSDQTSTDRWLEAVGGPGKVIIVVDPERESYAAWGLGVSSFWHILNPWSMYSVYTLGKKDGIWNRPTESGTRWQSSGYFAVDKDGVVRWGRASQSADDVPDLEEAVKVVQA